MTDSVSDVPAALAQELDITVLPILIRFGEEVYRDGIDLSPDEFYQKLVSRKDFPHTAVPSPGEVAQAYEDLAEENDQILSIHLSSKYSAFCEAALAARNLVRKKCRIEVVDSLSATAGEGLLVITAAKEAQRGASLEEIIPIIKRLIPKTHVRMAFDTLEYLKWGGRIGAAQALMGSLLHVQPIAGIREGQGDTIGVARMRSRAKALDWLYNYAEGFAGRIKEPAVGYATNSSEADSFIECLGNLFPQERIHKTQVGCVVGAHVGPRVLSVNILE